MARLSAIDHPIFQMISNSTRRKLLQLIACDKHYGNHLAKILNVSIPTAHRLQAQLFYGRTPQAGKRVGNKA